VDKRKDRYETIRIFEWEGDRYMITARSNKYQQASWDGRYANAYVHKEVRDVTDRRYWRQIADPDEHNKMIARYLAENLE